jgi:hypothetical protein
MQPPHQFKAMNFDRAHTDAHDVGNFLVGVPDGYPMENLTLSTG